MLKKKEEIETKSAAAVSKRLQYYNIKETAAAAEFVLQLECLKSQITALRKTPVFLCVGSDRATGDCFGPLVGDALLKGFARKSKSACTPPVYGTLHAPVHAVNLSSVICQIQATFCRPYVIAIDASLGVPHHVGYVTLSKEPLLPGIGVQKRLPKIGSASITGIVNLAGKNSHATLQATRLSTVVELVEFTAQGITAVF